VVFLISHAAIIRIHFDLDAVAPIFMLAIMEASELQKVPDDRVQVINANVAAGKANIGLERKSR